MLENVVVPDIGKLQRIKGIFSKEGNEKIHILSDFDRTLT